MTKISIPASFLPGVTETDLRDFETLKFGKGKDQVRMRSPVLTPSLLTKVIMQLKDAQEQYLSKLSVYDILSTIDKVVALWRDPDYPLRRKAEVLLPVITAYSSQMITLILDEIVLKFRGENLRLLLEEELGDPLFLDQFRPRRNDTGMCKAYGPKLTTAVFAGNIPGLPVANIVYALLMKSAILGKSASEEPLLAVLFSRSLAEVDPELARSVAMVCWKGGDEEIERIAFEESDAVVVYGGEHSVNEVRKRVPSGTRFIAYGHMLSFGIIGREYLRSDRVRQTAVRAAIDVSVFDQQGYLSPHVFYVEEGAETSPKEFARFLAKEMENFNQKIPRGRISADEAAHINQLRGSYEFREFSDDSVSIFSSSPGTDWTVIYESDPTFVPSCLNRTIRVKPVKDVKDVVGLVEPVKGYLQTVGAALPKNRFVTLADEMGQLGADRICDLGKMTAPSLTWHHDGRFNLLDLLRWTDIEAEFVHQPSREHKEIRFLVILNDLRLAAETTLESFDDLGQRLDCFCEVQDKADSLYEAVKHLDLRKDVRKQIALYIKDAVLNVYAEDLEKKNLESLLSVLDIARKEKLNSSDRRQIVRLLYKGGWHPYPNLKKGLSEVIAENE